MKVKVAPAKEGSFFELIRMRHSTRDFLDQPVEKDKLKQILESAILAPSAGNLQAYKIHVVTSPAQRRMIAKAAYDQEFLASAPVVLVFCAVPQISKAYYGRRGAELYALQDATIACCFAMLAATALGFGSVWVGAFDAMKIQKMLSLTDALYPVALLPIGYAASEPDVTERRSFSEMVDGLNDSAS